MLQVILGVIRCSSDFQKPCASKTAGLRVKDTSRSLCYPVLCGHCLPSCQAERQAPGLHVVFMSISIPCLISGGFFLYFYRNQNLYSFIQYS